VADPGIDWRAVGIGAAVGIGGGLLLHLLFRVFPISVEEGRIWLVYVLNYGGGMLVDAACGATAGVLARRRGALHGLLAGAIAALLSPLIGFAMMWMETRGAPPIQVSAYLIAIATGALLGTAIATAAGAIGARAAAGPPAA
jgi:hypothetical protein